MSRQNICTGRAIGRDGAELFRPPDKEGFCSMDTMVFSALGSVAALVFAAIMFLRVKRQPEGSEEMARISSAVRKGANAYLKRQYLGVGLFFLVVFALLLIMALCGLLSFFTPFAFVTGGVFPACPALSACAPPPWPMPAPPTARRTA